MRQDGNRTIDFVGKHRRRYHLRVLVPAITLIDNRVVTCGIVKLRCRRVQHRDNAAVGETRCLVQIVCIVIAVGDGEDDFLYHKEKACDIKTRRACFSISVIDICSFAVFIHGKRERKAAVDRAPIASSRSFC